MKKHRIAVLAGLTALSLAAVTLLSACSPSAEGIVTEPNRKDLVLASGQTAQAVIVVPENASEKVTAAAADLQDYLKRMTGAEFTVRTDAEETGDGPRILVGPTRQTLALGIGTFKAYPEDERILVRREGSDLILCGNDDGNFTGTQFAVTRFLEECGCAWFAEDDLWTVVPELKTLAVGTMNIEHTARFTYRMLYRVPEGLLSRWYQGGEKVHVGHGVGEQLIGKSAYDTYPEWFALVNGSRDPSAEGIQYWQFCYTNESLAQAVAKKVIKIFDENPDMTTYSVASNDGWEKNWCSCDTCTAMGSDTDEMILFANRIAEIVCQKYPDRRISILSYHSTYTVPVSGIQAHPNVDVMFCLETSLFLPLKQESTVLNGYNSTTHNTYTQSWAGNFREYIQKAGVKNVSIWGWYLPEGGRAEWSNVPWVQGKTMTDNLDLFEENGVTHVFYDVFGIYPELRWPLWYVSAKAMWDGSKDGNTLLREACDKLFGAASEDMFNYYMALADSAAKCDATSSVAWVPPTLFEAYWDTAAGGYAESARAKKDQLTDVEWQRVEKQLYYWGVTKMKLG